MWATGAASESTWRLQGPSIETQKCYSFKNSDLRFASDKYAIEKEIQGPHER